MSGAEAVVRAESFAREAQATGVGSMFKVIPTIAPL
jgi:hypothetical protein